MFLANLSETGFAAIGGDTPAVGERFKVSLPGGVTTEAQAVWSIPASADHSVHRFGARICGEDEPYRDNARRIAERLGRRMRIEYPADGFAEEVQSGWEIARVVATEIPSELRPFVAAFGALGTRDSFLWKWVYEVVGLIPLSTVDSEYVEVVRRMKFLGVVLDACVDDVADNEGLGERLDTLLSVPTGSVHPHRYGHDPRIQLAAQVWRAQRRVLEELPRYGEFADTLAFDYHQLMNAMRYGALLYSNPAHINVYENELYQPASMYVVVSATIDLMASPGFDSRDLGNLRVAANLAQAMARVANMLTTWQRELQQGDFTSGVFARVVERGIVEREELLDVAGNKVERRILASGIEQEMLDLWASYRDRLCALANTVHSVDLLEYVAQQERVLRLHLGCWGLI